MTEGSNRIPHLIAEIKSANVVFAQAQKTTASAAFVMGKNLIEAKELCGHGDWSGFLKATGLPPRTAQRYMRLVQSGFGSEYVGTVGVTEALKEIDEAQEIMPGDGQAVFARFIQEPAHDVMMWWRVDRHHGGMLQAYNDDEDDSRAYVMIFERFPIVFIKFFLDVMTTGLLGNHSSRELDRRRITFDERDEKIAIARHEAKKFKEAVQ